MARAPARFALLPLCLCLLGADAPASDAPAPRPGPTQATVPLGEYLRLKELEDRPGATVVEVLRLGGSFRARDLWIVLQGRAAGRMPRRPVLKAPAGLRIYGCEGDGLLTRGEDGLFELTPLRPLFRVGCRVAVSGSDRLQMEATPHVLYVESQIRDGEHVGSDDEGGGRSLSVVRSAATGGEAVPPSATARYLVSLHPEETRFRYQLEVRNPNRSSQPFVVELRGGEHVQQVDAQAVYEVEGPRYRFQLPPGEMTIALSGTLKSQALVPPIDASIQYLLLESHPLLRPQVQGGKRIGAAETGLTARFRGAQGFLLSGTEPLRWTVTRLEALRTISFAVHHVRHTFFLSADGKALGESALRLDNQGAPDLLLPMRAEPTFASLDGEATLLTRNEDGHLWLPLSQGPQQVVVQHRQALGTWMGLGTAELWLPQLRAPATRAEIELRVPREWVPLYAELAPESRLGAFGLGDLLGLLLLLLWTERVLFALGLARGRRSLLGAVLSVASLISLPSMIFVVAGDALVTVAWALPHLRRMKWGIGALLGLAGVGAILLLAGLVVSELRSGQRFAPADSVSVERKALRRTEAPEGAGAAGAGYQGLPARYELPAGARQIGFEREMLATEQPRAVRVVLLAHRVLALCGAALTMLGAALLLLQRRRIAEGWRRVVERA